MPISTSLTGLIARVSRSYKSRFNAVLNELHIDLSSEMCGVLVELWQEDGQFLQDFADTLKKDKGGMTKIVNSLEKRGLIRRVEDKVDRRRKKIFLTQKGIDLEQKLRPLIIEIRTKSLVGISAEDKTQLENSLYQIIENLDEMNLQD